MDATQKQLDSLSPVDLDELAEFCIAYAFASQPRRYLTTGRSQMMKHRQGRIVVGAIIILLAGMGAFFFGMSPQAAITMLLLGIVIGIYLVWLRP